MQTLLCFIMSNAICNIVIMSVMCLCYVLLEIKCILFEATHGFVKRFIGLVFLIYYNFTRFSQNAKKKGNID